MSTAGRGSLVQDQAPGAWRRFGCLVRAVVLGADAAQLILRSLRGPSANLVKLVCLKLGSQIYA